MSTATSALAPSTKQLDYARSLYREYARIMFSGPKFLSLDEAMQLELREIHAESTDKLDRMDRREISKAIDSMKGIVDRMRIAERERQIAEAPAAATPALSLEKGMYKIGETIYQVKPNREGTRIYAKKMIVIGGERLTETGAVEKIEFEYAPGAIYNILPEHRMGLDEGKALILRYGKCICCGRQLKAAKSVEQGIGPVCIKYFG